MANPGPQMFYTRPKTACFAAGIVLVRASQACTYARERMSTASPAWALEGGLVGRCREVNLAMVEAVLAGDGLERVAALAALAAGGAVAIVVPGVTTAVAPRLAQRDCDALERWVAARIRGRPAAVPATVLAEVPIRLRAKLVGIVALLAGERASCREAAEFLHLAATATMTELAIADARHKVEHELRGSLLEQLRASKSLDSRELVRRAARFGCDLTRGAVILCAELTRERPQLVLATIAEEFPGALAEQLDGVQADDPPRIYAALPAVADRSLAGGSPADRSLAGGGLADRSLAGGGLAGGGLAGEGVAGGSGPSTLAAAKRLATRLEQHGVVGLSSFHADPAELGYAAAEAELVLDVLLRHTHAAIAEEVGTGTYKLLFRVLASHPEELRGFHEATIAPLVRYDDRYHTELVPTLQAYLESNCSMNATASAIFAHRHTVAYRLDRIRDLTGLDPMRFEDRERLGLGLKVHRLISPPRPQ